MASPSAYHPPGVRPLAVAYGAITRPIRMIGHLLSFFCRAVAGLPAMLRHYDREFLLVGAWVCWWMQTTWQLPFWAGFLVTLSFMTLFGILLQIIVLRPLIG